MTNNDQNAMKSIQWQSYKDPAITSIHGSAVVNKLDLRFQLSLELEWLFPLTIWFLALPPNIFESSQDCGWRWHKVGSWWHGRGGRSTHHKKRGHSHKDMWCDRTSCLSLSYWGNEARELMKGRDFKIVLTFNRTQVRSLSTVVFNLDDPAYLNYPDHYDHLTTCRTTWTTLTNASTMNTWITLPTWTTLTTRWTTEGCCPPTKWAETRDTINCQGQ